MKKIIAVFACILVTLSSFAQQKTTITVDPYDENTWPKFRTAKSFYTGSITPNAIAGYLHVAPFTKHANGEIIYNGSFVIYILEDDMITPISPDVTVPGRLEEFFLNGGKWYAKTFDSKNRPLTYDYVYNTERPFMIRQFYDPRIDAVRYTIQLGRNVLD